MKFYDELKWRGLIKDEAGDDLEKIINEKPQEPKVDSNSHDFKDFIKNFDSKKTIDDF